MYRYGKYFLLLDNAAAEDMIMLVTKLQAGPVMKKVRDLGKFSRHPMEEERNPSSKISLLDSLQGELGQKSFVEQARFTTL